MSRHNDVRVSATGLKYFDPVEYFGRIIHMEEEAKDVWKVRVTLEDQQLFSKSGFNGALTAFMHGMRYVEQSLNNLN